MYVPVEGFQEQSRSKIVDELRRSIKVDNHEVVRIGELEKNSKAIKAVGPKFDGGRFSRHGAPRRVDELRCSRGEEGVLRTFIDTTNVEDSWGPPLLDEDWHAVFQAIYRCVDGSGNWRRLYYKFVEMNKAVNVRHPSGNSRTTPLESKRS